jgi:hypothetical protein
LTAVTDRLEAELPLNKYGAVKLEPAGPCYDRSWTGPTPPFDYDVHRAHFHTGVLSIKDKAHVRDDGSLMLSEREVRNLLYYGDRRGFPAMVFWQHDETLYGISAKMVHEMVPRIADAEMTVDLDLGPGDQDDRDKFFHIFIEDAQVVLPPQEEV